MTHANTPFATELMPAGEAVRVSIARYTAGEVIEQFLALYHCLDFRHELEEMGVSRFQFARRKKSLRELKALSIARWGLALPESFPMDAADFFSQFRSVAPDLVGQGKRALEMQNRVNIYVDLLAGKRDTDFVPVAAYLAEILALNDNDMRRLRLKLSLITRHLYTLIFDKLV
jgi:hypothetical protein